MTKKLCSFEGCDRKYSSKGLCHGHYCQLRRGRPLTPIGEAGKHRSCDLEGCESRRTNTGLCKYHTAMQRASEAPPKELVVADPSLLRHGIPFTYRQHGCRCSECTTAYRTAVRRYDEASNSRKEKNLSKDVVHGTKGSWTGSCKCNLCMAYRSSRQSETKYLRKNTDKEAVLAEQGYVCALCLESKDKYVMDHIHGTVILRGYLCTGCNTGLGLLGDNIEGVQKALDYLKAVTPKEHQ